MYTPADYRPITLLNTDYKILSRIIARRLNPVLEEHLRSTQCCGVPGNTIVEAIGTVREAITFAEIKKVSLCVLSLDFKNVFDGMSHKYLYSVLLCYGMSDLFIYRLKKMYDGATTIQLNAHTYGHIPIRC